MDNRKIRGEESLPKKSFSWKNRKIRCEIANQRTDNNKMQQTKAADFNVNLTG
jgi:hypothetical protein